MKKKVLFTPLVILITVVLPAVLAFCLPTNPTQYYHAYNLKQQRWDTMPKPRLMLVGYSEFAFGIDSKMIEDSTKYNVCNFGLHAGLSSDFILSDAVRNADRGDVILVAFPYMMYDEGTAQIQSFDFLLDVCPQRFWDLSTANKIVCIKGLYSLLKGKLTYNINHLLGKNTVDVEYNCENFNEYGDEVAHWYRESTDAVEFPSTPMNVNDFKESTFMMCVDKLQEIERKGAKVIIVPELMEEKSYKGNIPMLSHINKRLNEEGFSYAIMPEDFLLPAEYSYYGCHANRQGVTYITNKIIKILK